MARDLGLSTHAVEEWAAIGGCEARLNRQVRALGDHRVTPGQRRLLSGSESVLAMLESTALVRDDGLPAAPDPKESPPLSDPPPRTMASGPCRSAFSE